MSFFHLFIVVIKLRMTQPTPLCIHLMMTDIRQLSFSFFLFAFFLSLLLYM